MLMWLLIMTASKKRYYKKLLTAFLIIIIEAVIIIFLGLYLKSITDKNNKIINETVMTEKLIREDIKYFPIPIKYQNEVTFEDSFGAYRSNGEHEGCDIMDIKNVPGRIPVISATSGTITNIGWLYLGGYRIGITSDNGIYYYYAHLASYAAGLKAGDEVRAGQLIGFMGNTGEGEEGTMGKFPVHLHFGIYVNISGDKEQAVNSYPYLYNLK